MTFDMNSLNGASVRDAAGRTGRIVSMTEAAVNVAWMQKGLVAEEAAVERKALAPDIQVLTLKEGWQPLGNIAGVYPVKPPSKLVQLSEDLQTLFEKKATKKKVLFGKKRHSPFKNFKSLGPGPGEIGGTREVGRRTQWDCTKSGNRQRCVLLKKDAQGKLRKTDKVKMVKVSLAYKKKYNPGYKRWRSKQGW